MFFDSYNFFSKRTCMHQFDVHMYVYLYYYVNKCFQKCGIYRFQIHLSNRAETRRACSLNVQALFYDILSLYMTKIIKFTHTINAIYIFTGVNRIEIPQCESFDVFCVHQTNQRVFYDNFKNKQWLLFCTFSSNFKLTICHFICTYMMFIIIF